MLVLVKKRSSVKSFYQIMIAKTSEKKEAKPTETNPDVMLDLEAQNRNFLHKNPISVQTHVFCWVISFGEFAFDLLGGSNSVRNCNSCNRNAKRQEVQ